jgi:ubiquinone/menaquinone biosynthesis C-methylase UbiE
MDRFAPRDERAIEFHSEVAGSFHERYRLLREDAGHDCFVYSRYRLNEMLDRLLPSSGTGLSLVDLGCGTGYYMAEMRARGFSVTGVDASEEMLAKARQNNPGADLRSGTLDALPFPDGSFDVLLCVEVLRYIPDPRNAIREMARVLRPGGAAFVTAMPLANSNFYWLVNRALRFMPVGWLQRLQQTFTTGGRLRGAFAAAGFDPVHIHGVYTGPINWVEHLVPRALPGFLRWWEAWDRRLADGPILREFSNMFLVHAKRDPAAPLIALRSLP